MATVEFALGLTIGAIFYLWQHYKFRQQLKKIVNSVSHQSDREISLPPLSLMRRELHHLESQRQKLAEETNSWQEIVEQAPVGYLQVDRENQLLWCNEQARILLRIDRWREGEIRLLLELIRSYELDCLVEKTRKSQESQEQEWTFYVTRHVSSASSNRVNIETPDAPPQPSRIIEAIALKGYSLPLPNQEIGIFIVNRQPLVELSASRDRSVADLFHELKTPLTSISLVAETLVKRIENPERRWVEKMLQETTRLIKLVGEWLDLTQLEANPLNHLKYEKIELLNLIDSVWQTLEPIAQKKQVTLKLTGKNPSLFFADKFRLIQVFMNLLENAIKHSPERETIVVQVSQKPVFNDGKSWQIIIDIIDSGTGFTPSDLPYVFDRLYRGDKSRSRQFKSNSPEGSGLGLAIVQQIIQAHQGFIKAKNHPDLGGAWLQITLPVAQITHN
ncbi:signal transduction histidine kinase [Xenococcus sp. PCC 7305]|uniref:PAS domain-containing sensor histidine kinase n=1 Tax=Xenococcus sp. PCC 7305 TaxID=102125 RepID=UPI0002AC1527|nr:PAS domain-containing sensor histidine kinase [Xenococcus sp. PCC 7305]ELS01971.1 signal transduction histidine kinase [Xenococcus sp. PCC 7305]